MSYIGSNKLGKVYLGSTEIAKAYLGSDLVHQNTSVPSYVTSGLVFHLDGADATASQWVDRVGNIAFALTNTTLDGNGGVVFNGSAYGNYSSDLDFPSSSHTIEITLNKTNQTGMQVAFMINASNMVAFGFSSGNDYIVTKSGNSNARKTWETGSGLHTYSVTNSTAYKDKAVMTQRNTDTWYLRTGGTFVGARTTNNAFFIGTIYQIRIYNRALTPAEITNNQNIDMQRYNITT